MKYLYSFYDASESSLGSLYADHHAIRGDCLLLYRSDWMQIASIALPWKGFVTQRFGGRMSRVEHEIIFDDRTKD